MKNNPESRLARALISLDGLSVGDAFGEGFFVSFGLGFADLLFGATDELVRRELVDLRRIPHRAPWKWTDDTALAIEIVGLLSEAEEIDADELALRFARRYIQDPMRGYGGAMHSLLPSLIDTNWREAAPALFGGQGSFGNGAAMRVAPLGAYFADDLDECALNAEISAKVTHFHPEGVAGAIAVAVAAGVAAQLREENQHISRANFIDAILPLVPQSETRGRCEEARDLKDGTTGEEAAEWLGSGQAVSAQDTVPFCLFCAGEMLEFYEEALWLTVSGLGDRDTTCAIVGGIVAVRSGRESIPVEWMKAREALN